MVTPAVTHYQREHGDVRSTQCRDGAAGTTDLSLWGGTIILSVDRVLRFYLPLHFCPYALSVQALMHYVQPVPPTQAACAMPLVRERLYHEPFVNVSELDDSVRACHSAFQNLERVNTFKYLGATLAENGDLDAEMTHIIQTGWHNWKRVSGILCDRSISLRVKGKVYKTIVSPAMMYGVETWAVKKAQEKKLDVAEIRMLRWTSGVTKLDRIRNERIRGTTKVG